MVPRECSEGVLAPLQPPAHLSNFGLQPWPESQLLQNLLGKAKHVSNTTRLISMLWALVPLPKGEFILSDCLNVLTK